MIIIGIFPSRTSIAVSFRNIRSNMMNDTSGIDVYVLRPFRAYQSISIFDIPRCGMLEYGAPSGLFLYNVIHDYSWS